MTINIKPTDSPATFYIKCAQNSIKSRYDRTQDTTTNKWHPILEWSLDYQTIYIIIKVSAKPKRGINYNEVLNPGV